MTTIELGGNIKLSGFKDLEPAKLIVVKKMVGAYAKKIADKQQFQELALIMKEVHSSNFELKANVTIEGKVLHSEMTDYNLFFAMDKVLNKLIEMVEKQ
ncbi:MAG: hypothetical protein PHT54_04020 [Candidatus Nanoarchaeia archaeon]|nr:hypothetical protein [Candidatus Nanoarchaeia archaeon]